MMLVGEVGRNSMIRGSGEKIQFQLLTVARYDPLRMIQLMVDDGLLEVDPVSLRFLREPNSVEVRLARALVLGLEANADPNIAPSQAAAGSMPWWAGDIANALDSQGKISKPVSD